MFKRVINYLRTLFRIKAEAAMDPEVEIEQAIDEARKQDRQLRNQAAKVIAHREQLETKIGRSADQVGEAREMAKQALLRAERVRMVAIIRPDACSHSSVEVANNGEHLWWYAESNEHGSQESPVD